MSGQAGNIDGKIDPRGNKFEGAAQARLPDAAAARQRIPDKMAGAARSLGWHPFPGPAAVNSRSYQNRSACMTTASATAAAATSTPRIRRR